MRISDWSSDVCSSDLKGGSRRHGAKAFDVDVDVAVVKDGEDQEQLAALAPLIRRCAPPSPASGRRADSTDLPRAGEGLWSLGKSQIGRESGRERVCTRVDLGGRRTIKKTKTITVIVVVSCI